MCKFLQRMTALHAFFRVGVLNPCPVESILVNKNYLHHRKKDFRRALLKKIPSLDKKWKRKQQKAAT